MEKIMEFVLDDYQENVWHNGDEPCSTVEEIETVWEEFVEDCGKYGREIPEGITPELYVAIWNEEYNRRTKGGSEND